MARAELEQPNMKDEQRCTVHKDLDAFHIEAEYLRAGADEGAFVSVSATPNYEVEDGQYRWRIETWPSLGETWNSDAIEMSRLILLFPKHRKEIAGRYPHYCLDFGGDAYERMKSTIEFAEEQNMSFEDSVRLTMRTHIVTL